MVDFDQIRKEAATSIAASLAKYNLRQWGIVVVRTTYSSQTQWDRFMTLLRDITRDYFASRDMLALFDQCEFTVLDDAATLQNANLTLTSQRFKEWARTSEQARAEREGTAFGDEWMYSPRYEVYVHADEGSVGGVLGAEDREGNEFAVKVARAGMVLGRRDSIVAEEGEGANTDVNEEDMDEYDLLDLVKKVRVHELPDLYAVLGRNLDKWYNILTDEDGVCDI